MLPLCWTLALARFVGRVGLTTRDGRLGAFDDNVDHVRNGKRTSFGTRR